VTVHVVVDEAARLVLAHCSEDTVIGAVTMTVMGRLDPFNAAVRIAVWFEATVPAVAVKVAVDAVAGTRTEAGTANAVVALLESATVEPPVGAALERVTVHVVVDNTARLVLMHCSEVTRGGATSDRLAVLVTPLSVPVTVAN
jgi:hypothetical protein